MIAAIAGRIVVYDLEFTAWSGSMARRWSGPGEHREIVQIGAVIVDAGSDFIELAPFEVLVKPRINPILSDYFVVLTGITNEAVEANGVDFASAVARFAAFVGRPPLPLCSMGGDFHVIEENCKLATIANPLAGAPVVDLFPVMTDRCGLDPSRTASGTLPELLGFPAPGPKHQALHDARCIAEALRIFRRRGVL